MPQKRCQKIASLSIAAFQGKEIAERCRYNCREGGDAKHEVGCQVVDSHFLATGKTTAEGLLQR